MLLHLSCCSASADFRNGALRNKHETLVKLGSFSSTCLRQQLITNHEFALVAVNTRFYRIYEGRDCKIFSGVLHTHAELHEIA